MPFGLVGPAATYQDVVRHRFANQVNGRIPRLDPGCSAPVVNMVQLRLLEDDESLHTILEE